MWIRIFFENYDTVKHQLIAVLKHLWKVLLHRMLKMVCWVLEKMVRNCWTFSQWELFCSIERGISVMNDHQWIQLISQCVMQRFVSGHWIFMPTGVAGDTRRAVDRYEMVVQTVIFLVLAHPIGNDDTVVMAEWHRLQLMPDIMKLHKYGEQILFYSNLLVANYKIHMTSDISMFFWLS